MSFLGYITTFTISVSEEQFEEQSPRKAKEKIKTLRWVLRTEIDWEEKPLSRTQQSLSCLFLQQWDPPSHIIHSQHTQQIRLTRRQLSGDMDRGSTFSKVLIQLMGRKGQKLPYSHQLVT